MNIDRQQLEFRVLLVELSNQLSNSNREELHFILGDEVPRNLRDDHTPAGTLHLLEFLFDRALISVEQFDCLIHAFQSIGCHYAVQRLIDYERLQRGRTISVSSCRSSVLGISPLDEMARDIEEDKLKSFYSDIERPTAHSFSSSDKTLLAPYPSFALSTTIKSSERPSSVVLENKCEKSTSPSPKVFKTKYNTKLIVHVAINIFLICLLVILLLIYVNQPKTSPIIDKGLLYLVKEGSQHGGDNIFVKNQSFNDAEDLALSYAHRCIGVEVEWFDTCLASIRFIYSNNRSSILGRANDDNRFNRFPRFSHKFMLTPNEDINSVIVYKGTREMNINNSFIKVKMDSLIVGIRFRTTKGRRSVLFGSDDGEGLIESFAGYTLGHVKGIQQSDKWVEILQFVWIKQSPITEQIIQPPVHILYTCEFDYVSIRDLQAKHPLGVESSWSDLKRDFKRDGDSCARGASYYRTISFQGPQLFAIVNDSSVFYHDKGKWDQYKSAKNIKYGVIRGPNPHPPRSEN